MTYSLLPDVFNVTARKYSSIWVPRINEGALCPEQIQDAKGRSILDQIRSILDQIRALFLTKFETQEDFYFIFWSMLFPP